MKSIVVRPVVLDHTENTVASSSATDGAPKVVDRTAHGVRIGSSGLAKNSAKLEADTMKAGSLSTILKGILCVLLLAPFPTILRAEVTSLRAGAAYASPGVQLKVYSCAGPGATDKCDVQTFTGAQAGPRGPAPRGQLMALLRLCHPETPAEARALAHASGAGSQTGSSGRSG